MSSNCTYDVVDVCPCALPTETKGEGCIDGLFGRSPATSRRWLGAPASIRVHLRRVASPAMHSKTDPHQPDLDYSHGWIKHKKPRFCMLNTSTRQQKERLSAWEAFQHANCIYDSTLQTAPPPEIVTKNGQATLAIIRNLYHLIGYFHCRGRCGNSYGCLLDKLLCQPASLISSHRHGNHLLVPRRNLHCLSARLTKPIEQNLSSH